MRHINFLSLVLLFALYSVAQASGQQGQNIWWLISDVNNGVNQLLSQAGCGSTSLSQADAANGVITLSTPGLTYCLSQSCTAAIVVTAADVTVNLNEYTLTGTVSIENDRVAIRNGTILAPGAFALCDQVSGAVSTACDVDGTHISNCLIQCQTSVTPGLFGMNGVRDRGINTVIDRCIIRAGQGLPDVGSSADGGIGVSTINSSNLTVVRSVIVGGNGSDAAGSGSSCGSGGAGIDLEGNGHATIAECKVTGGNPGAGGGVGCGGDGILILDMDFTTIAKCTIVGTNASDNAVDVPGAGGDGIIISSEGCTVSDCRISSGNGGNSTDNSNSGGDGGNGITVQRDNATIYGCTILSTGIGGNGTFGGNGGDGVANNGSSSLTVRNCTITNTGAGGNVSGPNPGENGMAINDFSTFPTTTPSIVFGNFAYNIANTTQRYKIMNSATESGVAITSYGPPVAASSAFSFLDNMFMAAVS